MKSRGFFEFLVKLLTKKCGDDKMLRRFKSIPKETISAFAQSKGYALTSNNKQRLIEEVIETMRTDQIEELLSEHEHGGKGSVYIFQANNSETRGLTQETITERLEALNIGNPFVGYLRPELDRTPKIIYVEFLTQDKIYVLTAHLGTLQERFIGWEVEEFRPTIFSKTFIHMNDGIIEVRASGNSSGAIIRQIAHYFNLTLPRPVEFSAEDIDLITNRLGARSRIARHRPEAGGLEYIEYGAAEDVDDLAEIQEYQDEAGERPLRRKRLRMNYRQFEQDVSIAFEMAVDQCYILFKTPVGEGVINRVLAEVRAVKNIQGD